MSKATSKQGVGFSIRSVFVRCAVIMATTTLVVAAVMFVQSGQLAQSLTVRGVVDQADKASSAAATALAKPLRFKALPKVEEEVANLLSAAGENGRHVAVADPEGTILAESGVIGGAATELQALMSRAVDAGGVVTGQDGLLRAEPILAGPEGPVLGVLGTAWSADAALAATYAEKRRIFVTAGAIFLLMAAATVWMLKRSLGNPLTLLAGAVDRVAQGDYDTPVGLDGRRDELGHIARQIEGLNQTLRDSREAEQLRREKAETQAEMVQHLGQALDTLAGGILTHRIAMAFPEEYETLRRNYNRAVDSLRDVVASVGENAESILSNSEQIAGASDDLSRRTETQAATLEQSAAALEELLNSVNAAAENARKAEDTVRRTREIAQQNDEVMKSAVTAMSAIEKSSEQIGDIIGVIDDIAFQTNLLALNAGVEAARAGESGKGFAVVASEVRGLAQRSAEAAQQIKDLIISSGDQVKHGVELVEKAGDALQQMLSRVAEVSDMVTDIAHGAGEQARGLDEINVGIVNLDKVTQQNAAMVEESTAAAHLLKEDAVQMSGKLGRFTIDATADAAPARRRSAA